MEGVGIGRKRALGRLNELCPEGERHLQRIAEHPEHSSQNHWRVELAAWFRQMHAMLLHVGKKTAAEWRSRIEAYQRKLGE